MYVITTFGMLGTQEILIIGAVILVLFGGAKIPQLMRGLGRGMGEFNAGINEGKQTLADAMAGKNVHPDETEAPKQV